MIYAVTVCVGFWLNSEQTDMYFAHPRAAFRSEEEARAWGLDSLARIREERTENELVSGCPVGKYSFGIQEYPFY